MKRYFIPLFFLVITSCSDSIQEDLTNKMAEIQNVSGTDSHFVSYSDVAALTKAESTSTRASSNATAEIKCITGNKTNDTLLYVCQKQEGGWTVYSSDTRVPAIVAQSDGGSFDDLMKIEGAKLWIQSIADDMAAIRQLDDDKLNFTREEIKDNKAFWESISSPDEFVKKMLKESATRGGGMLDPNLEFDSLFYDGHWELRFIDTYTQVYDSIPRLTNTDWHQGNPYNAYCPLKSNNSGRAPAGCAAIAAAQMLYYLNDKWGVPAKAPSEAYCNGNIYNYHNNWNQYNYTSNIWNNMNLPNDSSSAPLIANIGKRLGMEYHNDHSRADFEDLPGDVFAPYRISCIYTDNFNSKIGQLRSSLLSGIPVILRAWSNVANAGHFFIADRYKRTRTVTAFYYIFVFDSWPPFTPIPAIDEQVTYSYSSPVINMIGMNWGEGDWYYNSHGYFSLTGDWYYGNVGSNPCNWNIDRMMIYGFSAINN